ncbi:MAG: ATP-dependent zinc metalloprotease FtsH [Thermodesulfobacteriota bacterium]
MNDQQQQKENKKKNLEAEYIPLKQPWHSPDRWMWYAMALLFIFFVYSVFLIPAAPERITYTQFLTQVRAENVEAIDIEGEEISGTLREPAEVPGKEGSPGFQFFGSDADDDADDEDSGEKEASETYRKFVTYLPSSGHQDLLALLESHDVEVQTHPEKDFAFLYALLTMLPFLLLIGLIYYQYRRFQGQGGEGIFGIGKSPAKLYDQSQESVTFADVAGARGAKAELTELVDYLKEPDKVRRLGAEVPRGAMLVGPPGTGKTLLAKAVAGEAGVPFFSITGSDFMEMFVGIGAKRVRQLFADAKKNAPSIIFIDELDAIGRRRGAGVGGGHDEREQTLNQMLSEMDGFESSHDVIVMSATNRPDVLDRALLRPGRFDRRIVVELPTAKDRREIIDVYIKNKQLADDVDLDRLARGTPGFSGADIKNVLNEAALLAARKSKEKIDNEDVEEARDKVMIGIEREGMTLTNEEKEMVAYHEAGHAIVGAKLKYADPVHKVSIVPRSQAMGVTQQIPEEEKYILHREYLIDRLAVMMGGRAAEIMIYKTATSGAGNDLQEATRIARKMVLEWGMSGRFEHMALGSPGENVFLGEEIARHREYSEMTAREVDREVESLLENAYTKAAKVLEENRSAMKRLADDLLENEEVTGARVYELLGEPEDV